MAISNEDAPLDLNRDRSVTKDEIDTAAGKKPGNLWTGLAGALPFGIGSIAGPAVMTNQKAKQEQWASRKDSLYKKYSVGPYAAMKQAPMGTQSQAQPTGMATTPGARLGSKLAGAMVGRPGGTVAGAGVPGSPERALADYERIYGAAQHGTLGVNQGLIDMGLVREQIDALGNIVYVTPRKGGESVAMQYKAQDAMMTLAEMDQEQLTNFRRSMYVSGYGTPATWVGPVTTSDIQSLVKVMTDANFSGGTWDEVVNQRVEAGGRYARPLTVYEGAMKAGDTAAVLKEYSKRNGIVLSDSFIANQTRAVAEGDIEMDSLLNLVKETYTKVLYPAFAAEIDAGLSIEDLAGPWRSQLAETFGVGEDQISLFDPLMQEALTHNPAEGPASKTSMREFANLVHEDPRWEYSPDAWNEVGRASDMLAKEFGFNNDYTQLGA